jgi:hypothetical protein
MTIRPRELLPMFTVTSVDGTVVRYHDLWQRRNLLLVAAPDGDPTAATYIRSLDELAPALDACDAALVITATRIAGIPSPAVVVADRWGEVYFVTDAGRAADLPPAGELLDWLRHVRNECPECQGEAR